MEIIVLTSGLVSRLNIIICAKRLARSLCIVSAYHKLAAAAAVSILLLFLLSIIQLYRIISVQLGIF